MVNDLGFVLYFPNVDSRFWTVILPLPKEVHKLGSEPEMGQWKTMVIEDRP